MARTGRPRKAEKLSREERKQIYVLPKHRDMIEQYRIQEGGIAVNIATYKMIEFAHKKLIKRRTMTHETES